MKLANIVDAVQAFGEANKGPVCVRLLVSPPMRDKLVQACCEPVAVSVPVSLTNVCGVEGLPVHVAEWLTGDQWIEQMSDGTIRLHGFEVDDGCVEK